VLIRKANDLVEARYKFDIWETRLFIKMLTMIRADDRDFFEYKIYINDLVKDFGMESSKDTYRRIKDGARKLLTKIIKVVVKDDGRLVELETPIVGAVKKTLEEGDGSYIKLGFYPDMKPFLLELKERYLVYDFRNVRNLPSPYYVRLYELLKQYERVGERRFEVDDLKEILGLTQEYKLYGHFKSKILDKAQAKLAEHTDISFTYQEIKKGRAVWALVFKIHKNRPASTTALPANTEAPAARQVAFFRPENDAAPDHTNPLFDAYFERLNEWWGVEADELRKRLENKTPDEVERAVQFTKERIKIGKAQNPAGVFLDALAKGHKTPAQLRADKLAEQKRREGERRARLQLLVDEYEAAMNDYSAAVNDTVRAVVAEHEGVTEVVIEDIKNAQRLIGNKQIDSYSIEDFRRDPMLRGMVIAAIMGRFPERFAHTRSALLPRTEEAKRQILAIEPAFRFG
jgi:plasmid replication initiation protein